MQFYDYEREETQDVKNYIVDEYAANFDSLKDCLKALQDDETREDLNDTLWVVDSVTGNGSGSYTFNEVQAEQNLVGNYELLKEALDDFDEKITNDNFSGEWIDVIIRCYLLNQCIDNAVTELKEENKD